MNGRQPLAVTLLIGAAHAGCAGPGVATPPRIPIITGADAVRVIPYEGAVPRDCHVVADFSVTDGNIAKGSAQYSGTVERATLLLRNEAARLNADTVKINDHIESVRDVTVGVTVTFLATAYRCK
jgi:hypothetical protein